MEVREIDITNKEEVAFIENLYIESFPHCERRPVDKMFELYKNNPEFRISITIKDENCLGFITHWDFGHFLYAEHFAISPEFRNGGHGRMVMEQLIKEVLKPVILEVELPTTELAIRRVGFYERLGFKLWADILYHQPSYHGDDEMIPMKLMSHGDINVHENIDEIKDKIYRVVYGVN